MRLALFVLCLTGIAISVDGALERIGVADGVTFYVERELQLSWADAKAYCRSNGRYFASIDTWGKNYLVENWLAANLGRNGALWTCGTDAGNEHNYYWDTSGQYLTYENWHFGLGPDPPPIDLTRNCLQISGSNQGVYWTASECENEKYFVCQG